MSSAVTARCSRAALATQPRMSLATLPTPLHDAVRLREALGGPGRCPRILIKRDDLTTLGLGGNKARKLEYLVADARAQGATTLITTGAVQSNHARMTAAAACVAGMRCVLVLTRRTRTRRSPATCCSTSCTAPTIRLVPSIDPMLAVGRTKPVVAEVVAEERAAGRTPYVIPVGGSSGVGVFGYVSGTAELVDQLARRPGDHAVAAVLRQRLARHAGGPDARREAVRGAVPGVRRRGQRRRAGEDRAREADRERGRDAAGIAGTTGARGSRHRSERKSARATAFRPKPRSKRSRCWRGPKRSCSIPVTRRRRWRA